MRNPGGIIDQENMVDGGHLADSQTRTGLNFRFIRQWVFIIRLPGEIFVGAAAVLQLLLLKTNGEVLLIKILREVNGIVAALALIIIQISRPLMTLFRE